MPLFDECVTGSLKLVQYCNFFSRECQVYGMIAENNVMLGMILRLLITPNYKNKLPQYNLSSCRQSSLLHNIEELVVYTLPTSKTLQLDPTQI